MKFEFVKHYTRQTSHVLNFINNVPNYDIHYIVVKVDKIIYELPFIPGLSNLTIEEYLQQVSILKNERSLPITSLPQINFLFSCLKMNKIKENYNIINNVSITKIDELKTLHIDCLNTVKIKLRDISDIDTIITFLKNNTKAKIRIDANQKLTSESLNYIWKKLKEFKHNIDYFEEPLDNYNEYLLLPKDIPYAHDELRESYLLEKKTNPVGIVIKPSQFGPIEKIAELKNIDKVRVIITHCYEDSFFRPYLLYIANFWPNETHGLNY